MQFALYDALTGGNLIWPLDGPETHVVNVSNGLFSVGLGSRTSEGIPTNVWNGDRYLEITVGGETLAPRELIHPTPITVRALTVPDGAIGTAQIADGAVTQAKAPFAASVYWQVENTVSQPSDMKILAATIVSNLPGGQPGTQITLDISSLGFSERPHAICQLVDTQGSTPIEFCHASWDFSTNNTLSLWLQSYSGGNLGPGPRRMNVILFGH